MIKVRLYIVFSARKCFSVIFYVLYSQAYNTSIYHHSTPKTSHHFGTQVIYHSCS